MQETQDTGVQSPGGGTSNPLQYLAWESPGTEEPGGLKSMGSQRIGHNLAHTPFIHRLNLYKTEAHWNFFFSLNRGFKAHTFKEKGDKKHHREQQRGLRQRLWWEASYNEEHILVSFEMQGWRVGVPLKAFWQGKDLGLLHSLLLHFIPLFGQHFFLRGLSWSLMRTFLSSISLWGFLFSSGFTCDVKHLFI